jgi:hypothetical protein
MHASGDTGAADGALSVLHQVHVLLLAAVCPKVCLCAVARGHWSTLSALYLSRTSSFVQVVSSP